MKSSFVRVPVAVEEYFDGDRDLFAEVGTATGLLIYVRLANAPVHMLDEGDNHSAPPPPLRKLLLPRRFVSGWHPMPSGLARKLTISGSCAIPWLWFRHFDCPPGQQCTKPSYREKPPPQPGDRKASLENTLEIGDGDAWVSRRGVTEAIARYNPTASPLPSGWPWGAYETSLLRHLCACAQRFWKNYDPSEPDTAPTKRDVVKWLTERSVTKRTAEQMDTILRAENLPKGPRRRG